MKLAFPLLATLGVGLTLAGCGGAERTPSTAPAAMRVQSAEARRPVVLHFRDRDQLDQLAKSGVDLFENVDEAGKTVGATLTERSEKVVRALGVAIDESASMQAYGFPAGYQTVDQVYADMKKLAAAHPGYIQYVEFGQSLETRQGKARRPMAALRFTSKRTADLPSVRLGSGIHARELPPVELMTRFAHTLADGYGKDAAITKLVDTKDIWIVPLQNPDGRARLEQGRSLWRKNTRQDGQSPEGVDCNRNADEHFAQGQSDPYTDDYRGASAFSEPESQALRDLAGKRKFDVSLDMHCYAGMILWPPGYDRSSSPDEAAFSKVGGSLGKQLGYKSGTIARTIYQAYGDNATWEYTHLKTLAFAAELDSGGFNPAYGEVDRQWAKWKAPLLYLVGQTQHVKR